MSVEEQSARTALLRLWPELRDAPDAMTEALSICRVFSLSPEELKFKWEAFVLSRQPAPTGRDVKPKRMRFDVENLREMRKDIQADVQARKASAAAQNSHDVKPLRKSLGKGGLDGLYVEFASPLTHSLDNLATPAAKKPRQSNGSMATPSVKPPTWTSPGSGPSSGIKAPESINRFETRTNALERVESLNDHLAQASASDHSGPAPKSRVTLAATTNPKTYNYRYMFERLADRSSVLDEQISEAAKLFRRQYFSSENGEATEFDFADPSEMSDEDVIAVGRIQTDWETAAGTKLSEANIVLETSILLGAGTRTPLKFSADVKVRGAAPGENGVGLFPGALVAVKGRNGGAGFFGVSEVLVMPPSDPPETTPAQLLSLQHGSGKLNGQPLSVVSACGPYTTEDNLDFAPFADLMDEAARIAPDVLILLGPFVDEKHPMVRNGDISATPAELFRQQISSRLAQLSKLSPSTTIILVPSVRDLISHHCVFPQSPFDKDPELGLPQRAKCLPNPAVFSINEVAFAVTSTDTLFHLTNQEYFHKAIDIESADAMAGPSSDGAVMDAPSLQPGDAMARRCRYILRQRSFYPIFPPPNEGARIDAVNLDVTHMELLRTGNIGADIFIVPSALKQFVKVVDSTVIINPGQAAKAREGGTFTRIAVHPMPRAELERMAEESGDSGDVVEHGVWNRARVDIIRV